MLGIGGQKNIDRHSFICLNLFLLQIQQTLQFCVLNLYEIAKIYITNPFYFNDSARPWGGTLDKGEGKFYPPLFFAFFSEDSSDTRSA